MSRGARELVAYVHVADDQQQMHVYGPGDEVPDWAAARITNPKAWKDGDPPKVTGADGEVQRLREQLAEAEARAAAAEARLAGGPVEDGGGGDGEAPPPRSGPGSGAPAWREYAARNGVEVAPDESRDDVIAALDAAKVRTQ